MKLPTSIFAAAVLASSSAFSDIYIPEGETGTVLHLDVSDISTYRTNLGV